MNNSNSLLPTLDGINNLVLDNFETDSIIVNNNASIYGDLTVNGASFLNIITAPAATITNITGTLTGNTIGTHYGDISGNIGTFAGSITGNVATFTTLNGGNIFTGNLTANTIIGNVASITNLNGTYVYVDSSSNYLNTNFLKTNITGRYNNIFGNVCNSLTTGSYNNVFGYANCRNMTGGSGSSSFGYNSLLNTTGSYNTAIGMQSGKSNTTGINNTFLGYNSDISGNFSNSTAIGANSKITAGNQIVLGTSTQATQIPGSLSVGGDSTFSGVVSFNNQMQSTNPVGFVIFDICGTNYFQYFSNTFYWVLNSVTTMTLNSGGLNVNGAISSQSCAISGNLNIGGYVGIGTTTPSYQLHVNGDILANNIRIVGTNRLYFETYDGGFYMNDSNYIKTHLNKGIACSGVSSTNYLNVGYSSPTATNYTLDVSGTAQITGKITTIGLRLQDSYMVNGWYGFEIYGVDNGTNGHDLIFNGRTTATGAFDERMRIKSNGNVGIGTNTPTYALDVSGTAAISGNLTCSKNITGNIINANLYNGCSIYGDGAGLRLYSHNGDGFLLYGSPYDVSNSYFQYFPGNSTFYWAINGSGPMYLNSSGLYINGSVVGASFVSNSLTTNNISMTNFASINWNSNDNFIYGDPDKYFYHVSPSTGGHQFNVGGNAIVRISNTDINLYKTTYFGNIAYGTTIQLNTTLRAGTANTTLNARPLELYDASGMEIWAATNLGTGAYNSISQVGDVGLFYTNKGIYSAANQALVIAPWNTIGGLRMTPTNVSIASDLGVSGAITTPFITASAIVNPSFVSPVVIDTNSTLTINGTDTSSPYDTNASYLNNAPVLIYTITVQPYHKNKIVINTPISTHFLFTNSSSTTMTVTINSITASVYKNDSNAPFTGGGVLVSSPSVSSSNALPITKSYSSSSGSTFEGSQYITNAQFTFIPPYANTTITYYVFINANRTFSCTDSLANYANGRYIFMWYNTNTSTRRTISTSGGATTFNSGDGVGYSAVSISESLNNDLTNNILANNIYCNGINSQGGDIVLNSRNSNIVNLYTEDGNYYTNPYATYSNWGGKVGYCIASGLASGGYYNNLYSMDFICNSGYQNHSVFCFYALSNTYQTAYARNCIIDGGFFNTSDRTTKANIANLNTTNSLNKILHLRPVHFQHIEDASKTHIGFISQEVQELTPATELLPFTKDASGNSINKLALNYNDLFIHNIGATQELYKMIETLQQQVKDLQDKIAQYSI